MVCQCGDVVVENYTLPANLTCAGDGLTVVSSSVLPVALDLGGKTLSGTDKLGFGLRLVGMSGAVSHGRIQNFDIGIGSPAPVTIVDWQIGDPSRGLTVTNNRRGLDVSADGTTLVNIVATSNVEDGVLLEGTVNGVAGLTCSKNGGTGLSVFGDSNVIEGNRCERNGQNGIHVNGRDNALIRNLAGSNGFTGVLVFGNGNSLESNQGRTNGSDGVLGFGGNLSTDGRNYGNGNGALNCHIDGHPTTGGKYC